jgi:hypothetical protein
MTSSPPALSVRSAIRAIHLSQEHLMNSITAAFIRTSRSIRRATTNLLNRLTRKASLKLAVTVSLPPFVKFAIDYKAGLSKPEIGSKGHLQSYRRFARGLFAMSAATIDRALREAREPRAM